MEVKKSERCRITEQLLKQYRDFKWEIEVCEMQERDNGLLEKTLNQVQPKSDREPGNLHTREFEKKKTLVRSIDNAAELLRKKPPYGELYYWSIYYTYLSPKLCLGVDEILNNVIEKTHLLSYKTYARRRKEAVTVISDILFGYTPKVHIPGLDEYVKR